MRKHVPLLVVCGVVLPLAFMIGLLMGAAFGASSGVAGLLALLWIVQYSRRVSGAKRQDDVRRL
jgi:hypothetical protein